MDARPTPEDQPQCMLVLNILRQLQAVDPEFPLQYAICLIEIHLNEGLSFSQLAERTGITLSTISRIVGALSNKRQKGEPFGMAEVLPAPNNRRSKQIFLTDKGHKLIQRLLQTH